MKTMHAQCFALLIFILTFTNSAPLAENATSTIAPTTTENTTESSSVTAAQKSLNSTQIEYQTTEVQGADLNSTATEAPIVNDNSTSITTTISPQATTLSNYAGIINTTVSISSSKKPEGNHTSHSILKAASSVIQAKQASNVGTSSEKSHPSLLHNDHNSSGHLSDNSAHHRHTFGHHSHHSKHRGVKGRVVLANTREGGRTNWGLTHHEAEVACQRLANNVEKQVNKFEGHLLSVESGNEISKLSSLLNPVPVGAYWTGGSIQRSPPSKLVSVSSEISLTWSDGEIGSTSILGISEDDINKLELNTKYCLAIDFNTRSWQARDCLDRLPYACLIMPHRVHFSKFVYDGKPKNSLVSSRNSVMNTTKSNTEFSTKSTNSSQAITSSTIPSSSLQAQQANVTETVDTKQSNVTDTTQLTTLPVMNVTEWTTTETTTMEPEKTTKKSEIQNFFRLFG